MKNILITLLITMHTPLAISQITEHNNANAYTTKDLGFSQATSTNGIVYLSGMVGWDSEYKLTGRGVFEDQLKQSLLNIEAVLKSSSSSIDNILTMKINVVGLDASKTKLIGTYLKKTFNNNYKPANTLVGISALARPELLIEIEVTAKQMEQ